MKQLTIEKLEEIERWVLALQGRRSIPVVVGLTPLEWQMLFAAARKGIEVTDKSHEPDTIL